MEQNESSENKQLDVQKKENKVKTPAAIETTMQSMMDATLKRVFSLGVAEGMKVMCGVVLETMRKNSNMNPQRQLAVLRQTMNKQVAKLDELSEKRKAAQSTNTEKQTNNTNKNDVKENDNESVSE